MKPEELREEKYVNIIFFFLSIAMTALALAAMAYYFGQLYSLGGKGVSRQLTRQTILR